VDQQQHIQAPDGAKLGYRIGRVEGAKHTLVMLSGLASNLTRWSEFVNATTLGAGWNLLRMDRRGHGTSMFRGRISRPIWVEDLQQIIQHEALAPVVLLGHSLGGEVVLDYALRYPQNVAGLILIDPIFPENLSGPLAHLRGLRRLLWLPILLLWLFNRLGVRRRQFPPRDLYAHDCQTRERLASDPQLAIADLYTDPWADLPYLPLANYLQDLYEAGRALPPLHAIRQPVLALISTGTDAAVREQNEARIAQLSEVECQWIDCDHWPLTEKPAEVRSCIDHWCLKRFGDN